jgi:hypothetical protein
LLAEHGEDLVWQAARAWCRCEPPFGWAEGADRPHSDSQLSLRRDGTLRIGAMTRHRDLEISAEARLAEPLPAVARGSVTCHP